MENEVMPYFTLRRNTDNYAHLLKKCFFKHYVSSETRMVRWNAQGGTCMI
jgi:hypothetical protein